MVPFFRRLRQRLLTENKFSKYFLYAIGEIILVVIGILIAISLNNGNQERIQKSQRDSKVQKLREIIYQDSVTLAFCLNYSKTQIKTIDSLIFLLDKDMSYDMYQSFLTRFNGIEFNFRTYVPVPAVYNELINSGSFSAIEDTQFKDIVNDIYSFYHHFNNLIEHGLDGLIYSSKRVYGDGVLSYHNFRDDMTDTELQQAYTDFERILNDPHQLRIFKNYLYEFKRMHGMIEDFYTTINYRIMRGVPLKPRDDKSP